MLTGGFSTDTNKSRFNERKSLNVIANDPKFRWCQGKPNGKPCGNGQIHVQGSK